jgi:hypothetical protein
MKTDNQNNTFWKIINDIGIEIPPIQRDYAQGRETVKVRKIRNHFLDTIIQALVHKKKESLDFVYGKIHGLKNESEHTRNKQAIQSLLNTLGDFASTIDLQLDNAIISDKSSSKAEMTYLIPLDGQQRLTTLFLLHWYIAKRLNKNDVMGILCRFRYKTRKSSTAFLKLITDRATKINFASESDIKERLSEGFFYEEIKNNEHFSLIWLADPTVHAMMIMLQAIHYKLQDEFSMNLEEYWKGLTEDNRIFFSFLDLKDFNLSDDLYVKMNGRGKQLSSFENFKAWLFGVIEDKKIIDTSLWEDYKQKFDVAWNDIFWKYKAKNVYDVDASYFNYFKKLLLFNSVRYSLIENNNFKKGERTTYLIEILTEDQEFEWEYYKNEVIAAIADQFRFLSLFDTTPSDNMYITLFANFIFGGTERQNWQLTLRNYISFSFIKQKDKKLSEYTTSDFEHLNGYHRILFNLFDNTIIDNQNLYKNAIVEIDELNIDLKNKKYSIVEWVNDLSYTPKSVFTQQQILEEILKFRLLANDEWRNLIYEAEKVTYFERQLNFWFFKTDISLLKEEFSSSILENEKLKKEFSDISIKINMLFDDKGINRKTDFSEKIFERALLSKSDYLLDEKGYKCFGRNSGRDVGWKRLFFRDRNSEKTNVALTEIFDLDFTDIKKSFEEYISVNLSNSQFDDWQKKFVVNKNLFEYLGEQRYIRKINVHGWVIIKDSYKTYTGAHYELFSLDFYQKYIKESTGFSPFLQNGYYPATKDSIDEFPCAYLNWETDNFKYAINIKFIFGKYCLIFFSRDKAISAEVINKLLELKFISKSDYFLKNVDNEIETLRALENLCLELNNLNQ